MNNNSNNNSSGIQSMDSDEVVSEGHGPDLQQGPDLLESQGESCDACASDASDASNASNVWTYVDTVYSNAELFNMEDMDFEVNNPYMQHMQHMQHMQDMPGTDTDIPIEEEILNLNNKVSNLLTLVQAKDAKVVQLENKVSSLTSIIDIMTKDGDETKTDEDAVVKNSKKKEKKPGQTKTSAKLEFYKEYKDDPVVEEQVELFKKTFPQITKPPWQFRKAITDHMYKEAQ